LEGHFVHKNQKGELAVVGVLFKEGKANPALQKLISFARNEHGEGQKKTIPFGKLLPLKDTRTFRIRRIAIQNHRRVIIESNVRSISATVLFRRAHDDGAMNVALLHAAARNCVFYRDDDDVADGGEATLRTAEDLNAHNPLSAGVIRNVQITLHLNHDYASLKPWQ